MKMNKETYLYVGHYIDRNGNYILKLGTTNNLDRRQKEHTKNYHKAATHTMREEEEFVYDWFTEIANKYQALECEDINREKWKELSAGRYLRNDRFVCEKKPRKVEITTLETTYKITL